MQVELRHWDVMTRTFMLSQGHIIMQTQTIINHHLMQHQSSFFNGIFCVDCLTVLTCGRWMQIFSVAAFDKIVQWLFVEHA